MALSIELLNSMDDAHAINALRADFDPLTNTPLEAYLIDWIESLIDDGEYVEAANEHDLEPDDIKKLGDALIQTSDNTVALLNAIGEAGIDTPEALAAELGLAEKFRALAKMPATCFPASPNSPQEQQHDHRNP